MLCAILSAPVHSPVQSQLTHIVLILALYLLPPSRDIVNSAHHLLAEGQDGCLKCQRATSCCSPLACTGLLAWLFSQLVAWINGRVSFDPVVPFVAAHVDGCRTYTQWQAYLLSLYWAAASMLSVGYGDLHPTKQVRARAQRYHM